jgi:hypothetical protein
MTLPKGFDKDKKRGGDRDNKSSSDNNDRMLSSNDIINGKISLTDLPKPYVFIYDVTPVNAQKSSLPKAVSILAKDADYRIVAYASSNMNWHSVCMVKQQE